MERLKAALKVFKGTVLLLNNLEKSFIFFSGHV